MLLVNFDQVFKATRFDTTAGMGDGFRKRRGNDLSGFCTEGTHGWAAVYPRDGLLIVQVNLQRWTLALSSVEYEHLPEAGESRFKITDGANTFEHVYPSWWTDGGDPYGDWLCEDEDNDIFGYIAVLRTDHEMAINLAEVWSGIPRQTLILCPYCVGTITQETVHCGHCGDDVRNDSAFAVNAIVATQMAHSARCTHCEKPMSDLALKCPHCRQSAEG